MIVSRPPRAAILFAGASMLQLPTPTPAPMPELPLSEVERIINTASNQAKELSLQQMVFVVIVLLIVFGIVMGVWLIRRPNKPKAEQTVVESAADLVTAARQDAKDAREQLIKDQKEAREQNAENITILSDASNRLADGVDKLDGSFDRLTIHIEQLASRETARDKTLQSMSGALETMVQQGSEPLRQLITDVAALVKKIDNVQCGQDELKGAIEVLTSALKTCEKKQEDTGKVATVSELDAESQAETDSVRTTSGQEAA
jgi:hypothetical protein